MTQDEIIEMAIQAHVESKTWIDIYKDSTTAGDARQYLKAFAKLIAEKEREACAMLCDEMSNTQANMNVAWRNGCRDAATEIRARGQA